MDKKQLGGLTIKRCNSPSKYDNNSQYRLKKCDCCDEQPIIQIILQKAGESTGKQKLHTSRLFLCKEHMNILKDYLAYFE